MAEETNLPPIGGSSDATVGEVGQPAAPTEAQDNPAPTEEAEVVYYYHASKNELGEFFAGVPHRDLTRADVDSYPKWIQKALKGSKVYLEEPEETEPAAEEGQ